MLALWRHLAPSFIEPLIHSPERTGIRLPPYLGPSYWTEGCSLQWRYHYLCNAARMADIYVENFKASRISCTTSGAHLWSRTIQESPPFFVWGELSGLPWMGSKMHWTEDRQRRLKPMHRRIGAPEQDEQRSAFCRKLR